MQIQIQKCRGPNVPVCASLSLSLSLSLTNMINDDNDDYVY